MNDAAELRSMLFETMRGLKDGELDVEKAKAINETAQTIINSAKVEVDYIKTAGGKSRFLDQTALPNGVTAIRQNRLAG